MFMCTQYKHIFVHTYVHTSNTYIHARKHARTRTHTHPPTHKYIYIYARTHAHLYARSCTRYVIQHLWTTCATSRQGSGRPYCTWPKESTFVAWLVDPSLSSARQVGWQMGLQWQPQPRSISDYYRHWRFHIIFIIKAYLNKTKVARYITMCRATVTFYIYSAKRGAHLMFIITKTIWRDRSTVSMFLLYHYKLLLYLIFVYLISYLKPAIYSFSVSSNIKPFSLPFIVLSMDWYSLLVTIFDVSIYGNFLKY